MGAKILLSQDRNKAILKPSGYLGTDFGKFREAIEGSTFDGVHKVNVAPLDKVPRILKRLREAGFPVEIAPDLGKSLEAFTAQNWQDLQFAKERADAIDEELRTRGKALYPYQRVGVQWLATKYGALLADDMGLGKAQPVTEKVLTPKGWRKMGELRVGDYVIGSNGAHIRVLGVYPQGKRPVYRVTTTDGASTTCDEEHLWLVQTPNDRARGSKGRVMKTRDFLERGLRSPKGNSKWFIPILSQPAVISEEKSSVNFYIYGALLANGGLTQKSRIRFHGNKEQRDILRIYLDQIGYKLSPTDDEYTWNVAKDEKKSPRVDLLDILRNVGVHGKLSVNKFIPQKWLYAPVAERVSLLSGLMDNDGTVSSDGMVIEYNTSSPRLAKGVMELARSLGAVCWVSKRFATYEYKGEKKLSKHEDYRIRFSFPRYFNPFLVLSKRDRVVSRTKYLPSRAIEKIEFVGSEDCVCIRVSADDMLYVTRDYLVTHNTAQTLAALPASVGVVVVAPALAKGVWRKEVPMWRPHLTPRVLEGRGSFRWPEKGEVIIVNYDILPEAHEKACKDKDCRGCATFLKSVPQGTVVVADEAHNLKNSKAQRTLRFRAISQAARDAGGRTWLLTATPLLNRPQELWSIYQAAGIAQEAFGSFKQFVRLFNGRPAKFGGFNWGEPNQEEIIERIRAVSLRRTKDEVLTDIPGKRIMTVPVEIDAKTLKLCDKVLEQMGGADRILELLASKKLDFEKLSAVRAALASAKIPAMLDLVEEYEELEEPLVLFSAHRAPVDLLREREGWRVITGDTSSEERSEIVELFQEGKLKGVGCTIKAGGVAITLTRACHELFVDREWTPGLNAQAEDRCYRIGQKRGVLVKVLEADHTLDSRMNELLGLKQAMIDASVEAARETIFSGMTDLDAGVRSQIQAVQEALRTSSESEAPTSDEHSPSDDDAPDAPPRTAHKPGRRPALSPEETWAHEALLTLSGLDGDRASQKNDVGFNRMDGTTGHSLARQLPELTDAQWKLAIKICRKYHGQVGECPEEVT